MSEVSVKGSLFLVVVAIVGCGGGADAADLQDHGQPSTVQQEITAEGDSAGSALDSDSTPVVVSPDIDATLEAANAVSDEADGVYERKVFELRRNAVKNAGLLRRAIERLPAKAHGTRQIMLSLLGDIATQPVDAHVLESFATRATLRPLSLSAEHSTPADEIDSDNVTTWQAMFALARLGQRVPAAAEQSIQQVLRDGSRRTAFVLGVELQESGRFTTTHRRILERRRINPHYEKSDTTEQLTTEPLSMPGIAEMSSEPPQQAQ